MCQLNKMKQYCITKLRGKQKQKNFANKTREIETNKFLNQIITAKAQGHKPNLQQVKTSVYVCVWA